MNCKQWPGSIDFYGYGRKMVNRKRIKGHRWAYQQYHKLTDEQMATIPCIRHTCDYPPCIEETHLIPGTHKENTADMMERGRASNGDRKLTPAQAREIRESPMQAAAIARLYGVSRTLVSMIRKGKAWSSA